MSVPAENWSASKRIIRVTRAEVAAARGQIHISEQLGVPVPPVIRKVARAKPRRSLGVDWYLPGRHRPFTSTTVASSDLLGFLAGEGLTFDEARAKVLWDADAVVVLDAFIAAGFGASLMTDLGVRVR